VVIDILITNFVSKSYDFSTYGESIVKPTIIGIITIGLSTLFWLTQSDPTLQPSLSVNNPISSMANFTGTANFTNPNHLLKSFERSFADFLPLLPMGSEIKVGIIDYIIKIVGGAVVAFVISAIIVVLLTPHSLTNTLAQSPQSSIKDQNIKSLDVKDAAYNANTSKFLGSKNITLTPNRITEIRFTENGFLNGVGNVTNNKTCSWEEEKEHLRLQMDKVSTGYLLIWEDPSVINGFFMELCYSIVLRADHYLY
jgi:hypothetical protein